VELSSKETLALQLEALEKPFRLLIDAMERAQTRAYLGIDDPLTAKARRMRYLMDTGYADAAGEAAKDLATEALADMGRRTCPYTGNQYFYEDCY
jgi:hypothetical protein